MLPVSIPTRNSVVAVLIFTRQIELHVMNGIQTEIALVRVYFIGLSR